MTQAPNSANPNDPWNLTTSQYDPDKFYTRATDGNGHDTTITVKVSPALLGQVQHIVQSRMIPEYRTYADVVRDAMIHRMRYVHDNYQGSVNLADLEIEQRQAELDRVGAQRAAWKHFLETLDKQLTSLIEEREYDEAEWLMEQNAYLEHMTTPFLKKLAGILAKHQERIKRETRP